MGVAQGKLYLISVITIHCLNKKNQDLVNSIFLGNTHIYILGVTFNPALVFIGVLVQMF